MPEAYPINGGNDENSQTDLDDGSSSDHERYRGDGTCRAGSDDQYRRERGALPRKRQHLSVGAGQRRTLGFGAAPER